MRRERKSSTEEKDVLIERISNILKTKEYVLFAYIFGSFASGERFNDIDVGIFISGERTRSPLRLELEIENELEDSVRMPVDVRIINNAPLSFIYNILKNNIVVVDKDRSFRTEFEGLIYKKYFDFQHLRREYLREIINAPV